MLSFAQSLKCAAGGGLLGFFLRSSAAGADELFVEIHLRHEHLVVVGAGFTGGLILKNMAGLLLNKLLKLGLVIRCVGEP